LRIGELFSTAVVGDILEIVASSWDTVAALADPVRRALFDHVRHQDHPVTREEAGDAVAISRNLCAFHLDKLVDAGLLRARYESPPDKQRGRGRTPKVYEPTGVGLALSVPPRHYELVGEILADAVAEDPADAKAAARDEALAAGRRIGAAYHGDDRAALEDLGFEPRDTGDGIALDNCPFHTLAQRQPELICGLNVAFVTGLLEGLGADDRHAELRPRAGACCVHVTPTPVTPEDPR
jgi:predicted ArsR family transcriptional regulator